MKLTFKDIVENLDIVKSLERIMRISPLRIKVLTSKSDLQAIKNSINQYKNQPKYIYEVVIAPDATNDTTTPKNIVQSFINNQTSLNLFASYMPNWNSAAPIRYRELRPIKPILTVSPRAQRINFYNATFTLKMWERTNLYAVLVENLGTAEDSYDIAQQELEVSRVSQLSADEKAKAPSSLQIRNGKNKDNSNAGQYRKVIASTDDTGNGTIFVDDLKEGATYELYLTASSYLPYEPTVLWEDDEVIKITFKTLHNPNLMKANRHIEDIKRNVPELGAAIERFIKIQEQKKEKYGRIRTY